MKKNQKYKFSIQIALLLLIIALTGLLTYFAYIKIEDEAYEQIFAQEKILAEQAESSIKEYFIYLKCIQDAVGQNEDVALCNDRGKILINNLYNAQEERTANITRIDKFGKIIYSYPDQSVLGRDISYQSHVKEILKTHKPIVSSLFKAVQGYKSISFLYPVFYKGEFDGALGILIPFDKIADKFIAKIKVGKSGYAFMLDANGTNIYSNNPKFKGKNRFEIYKGFPSLIALTDSMIQGKEGPYIYEFNRLKGKEIPLTKKIAYYKPIRFQNTFWSVCITAPESEALALIKEYQFSLEIIVFIFIISCAFLAFYLFRTLHIVGKEKFKEEVQMKIDLAESERKSALALLDSAIMQLSAGVIIIKNPDLKIIKLNNSILEICTGIVPENIDYNDFNYTLNCKLYKLQDEKEIEDHEYPIYKSLTKNEIISNEVYFIKNIDGSKKYVSINSSPIKNANDETIAALTIVIDISEIKKNEELNKKLQERLIQSQKMESIGRLAGGIAHDFNNLMTPIMVYSELILNTANVDDTNKLRLENILKSVISARDLVGQLLAFARKQSLELKVLNINEVIENFKNILRRTISENIEINYVLSDNLSLIKADSSQIEQIIMNLCVNSKDAMPNGGKIIIETKNDYLDEISIPKGEGLSPGSYTLLSISDTGSGMDEETKKNIFEPFFTTKNLGHGTGLGLATVHGIVRQHGGHIWLYSEDGKGSTFKIYFPISQENANDKTIEPEKLHQKEHSETILLVEDQDTVREICVDLLTTFGFKTISAANAKDALIIAESYGNQIDLLITDVILPDINGKDLSEQINVIIPKIKIIYMSGYTSDVLSIHQINTEGLNFIQKPFSINSFIDKVREVLDA